MKQRKINLMYLLLVAVFVLSSCAKSSKISKFIPADAAVVSIDVKQMFEKSKVGDNEEAKKKLLEAVEGTAKTQEAKDLIKKIVDDPAKAGVDLREPIYIFNTAEGQGTAIGTILDKDDFAQLLKTIAKEGGSESVVKEKDGVQYLEDKQGSVLFNDEMFYITEANNIDDIIAKFKNDDTQNTMAENEDFAKLAESTGYIKALIPMAIVEGQVADIKKSLPEGAELKDLSIIMNVTSDKGVAKLDVECLAKSDAWKKYIDESNQIFGKISGDYVKYIEKGALAFFANFDGKKLFEMIDKKEVFKNLGVDKKVFESIDGDLAIGVGEFKGGMPNVAAYIKTKDQSVVDVAKENGMNPEKGMDFGFKDGTTYVAVGETSAFTEAKETYQNVKGRRFYIACDIDLMSNLAGMANDAASQNVKAVGEHVSSAEMYDTSDTSIELILNMKDKEKDPLEYFMGMFLKQIM